MGSDKRIDYFASLASQLGLDVNKLKSDIALDTIAQKIKFDQSLGTKAGVDGTPTVFLNGTKIDITVINDATKLKSALDTELKKVN